MKFFKSTRPPKPMPYTHPEPIDPPTIDPPRRSTSHPAYRSNSTGQIQIRLPTPPPDIIDSSQIPDWPAHTDNALYPVTPSPSTPSPQSDHNAPAPAAGGGPAKSKRGGIFSRPPARIRRPDEEPPQDEAFIFRGGEDGIPLPSGNGFPPGTAPVPIAAFGGPKRFFGGGGISSRDKEQPPLPPLPPSIPKTNDGGADVTRSRTDAAHNRREKEREREKKDDGKGWHAKLIPGLSGGGPTSGTDSWESHKSGAGARKPAARELTGLNSWESRRSVRSVRQKDSREGRDRRGTQSAMSAVDDEWDITREIGWLTAHASEDWGRVLELCDRVRSSDAYAKEAARALRKDIKYGEPSAQLSAARLWAIMLRNCGEVFFAQTQSRKFLESMEGVLNDSKTSPVVRERLLHVLSSAAYTWPRAIGENAQSRSGFAYLWKKVRPEGSREEGEPFDDSDPMFNPPFPRGLAPLRSTQPEKEQRQAPSERQKHRIISPDEDRRRLLEECDIARNHANVLTQMLAFADTQQLREDPLIKEFHDKCLASREVISSQLEWAEANARRSRERALQQQEHTRAALSDTAQTNRTPSPPSQRPLPVPPSNETREEQLFGALLQAHQELMDVFRMYDDLERVLVTETQEREVEERSKYEMRLDRSAIQIMNPDGSLQLAPDSRPSKPRTPSETPSRGASPTPYSHSHIYNGYLPPPPPPPMGPRRDPRSRSRSPSPERWSGHAGYPNSTHTTTATTTSRKGSDGSLFSGSTAGTERDFPISVKNADSMEVVRGGSEGTADDDDSLLMTPVHPSEKALGKRPAKPPSDDDDAFDPHDLFRDQPAEIGPPDAYEEDEDGLKLRWGARPVRYAYDAAAEREKERQRQMRLAMKQAVVTY